MPRGLHLRSLHGKVFDPPAVGDSGCPVVLREAWGRLQQVLDVTTAANTFQQLLDARENKMYYI